MNRMLKEKSMLMTEDPASRLKLQTRRSHLHERITGNSSGEGIVPTENRVLERMLREKIIAVVRLDASDSALGIIDGIVEGNISIIEITLTTPGAIELIERLASRDDLLVGAGTVLDLPSARAAFEAGAKFYASPVFDPELLSAAKAAGVVAMPGAYTPTEIHRAWRAGADLIKIFPMPTEGERFIRTLRGPFPDVRLAPSGGVTAGNAIAMLAAGASALNVGTWLTHEADGTPGRRESIRERGVALVERVGCW
jgi:2-dehydro-3-deoxyphosphogluconate aldolase/(4S)-4-hydroxy-2-oxoglutarate aldolase